MSYNVQEYDMRKLFKNKRICIQLNKNSREATLNSVLCASVCWIFRTHDTFSFQTWTQDIVL